MRFVDLPGIVSRGNLRSNKWELARASAQISGTFGIFGQSKGLDAFVELRSIGRPRRASRVTRNFLRYFLWGVDFGVVHSSIEQVRSIRSDAKSNGA
jgi:hypothetical protein